jgi:hypothetical protein
MRTYCKRLLSDAPLRFHDRKNFPRATKRFRGRILGTQFTGYSLFIWLFTTTLVP